MTLPPASKLSGRPGGQSVVRASGPAGAASATTSGALSTHGLKPLSTAPAGGLAVQAPTASSTAYDNHRIGGLYERSAEAGPQRSHSRLELDCPSLRRTQVDAICDSSSKLTTISSPSAAGNGSVGGTPPSPSAVVMTPRPASRLKT